MAPWFIIGFALALFASLRSAGALPSNLIAASGFMAAPLTVVSMAALDPGVAVRALLRAGFRPRAVVTLPLAVLGGLIDFAGA